MALTEEQKKRLGKMEFANGGGYSDFMTGGTKAKPSGNRYLFIGLGGKGSQTVAGIKTGVYKKIQCPAGKMRPDNFEYLIIDTDEEGSIKPLTKGGYGDVPLSQLAQDMETVQLYDENAAVILKAGAKKQLPSHISEWINPNLNANLQGKGAGGVRQAGRYLLFGSNAFTALRNALTAKLKKLAGLYNGTGELIVYIFAGVGGGTGSGTVIDIPYIVREICEKNKWAVKLHGYIFLPDTYAEEQIHQYYNSYAALKEIDTLMNIGQMNGAAHFRATYMPNFAVDSTERIFDSCVLVSGKKNSGKVSNPDRFCRSVVVENIINLVSDTTIKNAATGQPVFLANSFLDNNFVQIRNAVTQLPNTTPRNAYYQYIVIGTGEVILPMEQVMAYLAEGVMGKLETAWDLHPQAQNATDFLQKLHAHPEEQAQGIEGQAETPVMKYVKEIGGPATKTDVISGRLYTVLKNLWMERNVSLYIDWDKSKQHYLEQILSRFDDEYNRLFQDKDAGLYYLRELIANRAVDKEVSFNGVLERVKTDYYSDLQKLLGGQGELRKQCKERRQKIETELSGILGGSILKRNDLIEEYREVTIGELAAENRMELYGIKVKDCLDQIVKHIENKLEELQKYIDVFAHMKDIVHRNYACVMGNNMPQAEYADYLVDFSKRDQETQHVLQYLDGLLAQETPEGLTTALENTILKTERQWLDSEEKFEPMKVFVGFLEGRFAQIPNLTIEKFMLIKYGANGFAEGITALCKQLRAKADVVFSSIPGFSLQDLPSHTVIVVPSVDSNVKTQIQGFVGNGGNAAVGENSNTNSIVWYNLIDGVPLFANSDIDDNEKYYEKNEESGGFGKHIWESSVQNWNRLPALSRKTPNVNQREKKLADEVRENTQCFLEKGVIRLDHGTGLYMVSCVQEESTGITREAVQEWCEKEYLTAASGGAVETGSVLWQAFCQEFAVNLTEYPVNLPIIHMQINNNNLHEVLRMNIFLYDKIKEIYQFYELCEGIVERFNGEQNRKQTLRKAAGRFYEYVRNGIIQIQEKMVLVETKSGEQEGLLYFENYTLLDNRFFVYWAVKQMTEHFTEEKLAELDQYAAELNESHTEEAMSGRKQRSDRFMEQCIETREFLKKLETKNALKDAGKEAMLGEYTNFYDVIISLRKG